MPYLNLNPCPPTTHSLLLSYPLPIPLTLPSPFSDPTPPRLSSPLSVIGTGVNYQELSSVAQLPFQQKVDWLKNQFAALRTPWEEGHIKLKVGRWVLAHQALVNVID